MYKTDTDANIENDFLLFFEKISLRNCVLNPDSRREKEKEKVFLSVPLVRNAP